MSVFRPAARVTGPDGRGWEVYAFRLRLPPRRHGLAGILTRPLDLAVAGLRALRSDAWTIEALTLEPRTTYRWTTTGEYRDHVVAQIEGRLARGEVPAPRHATYLGAR